MSIGAVSSKIVNDAAAMRLRQAVAPGLAQFVPNIILVFNVGRQFCDHLVEKFMKCPLGHVPEPFARRFKQ